MLMGGGGRDGRVGPPMGGGRMGGPPMEDFSVPPPFPPPQVKMHLQPPRPQMQNAGINGQDVIMKLLQAQQQQQHMQHQMQPNINKPKNEMLAQMLNLPSGGGGGGGRGVQDRPDVLGRPDVHALLMQVAAGHTTAPKLMQTMAHGNISSSQRESIQLVLQFLQSNGPRTLTPSPTPTPTQGAILQGPAMTLPNGAQLSPRVASPNPDPNTLNPHLLQQQQQRVSP